MQADTKKVPSRKENRREFLKTSGKVAAGAAVALPIVMTLSPDKAKAAGSCGARFMGGN